MFTLKEILQATQGTLIQGKDLGPARRVSTDSRQIRSKDLFIAIVGDKFDGHNFINEAAQKKVSVLIVSKEIYPENKNVPVVLVKDTVKALGALARFHRNRFKVPIIAITGSAGKTTTKEMIAKVLEQKYKVLKNIGTENNQIGVPHTLLKLNKSHEIVVLELGTNSFGEIRHLTQVCFPDVAIFTTVGESHLELLKSPAGVFKEKSDLIKFMNPKGLVIYNRDNKYLRQIPARFLNIRSVSYGIKEKSDHQACAIKTKNNRVLEFEVHGIKNFQLPSISSENVHNALAALSCSRMFKISYNEIKLALRRFKFPKHRQVVIRSKGYWIIDDTYNANPISVKSALKAFANLKISGRKIFVFADMLELGEKAKALHREIGKLAACSNVDFVLTLGTLSKWVSDTAQQSNPQIKSQHYQDLEQLQADLKAFCQTGDAILVKGSRRMKMERVVEFLVQNLK